MQHVAALNGLAHQLCFCAQKVFSSFDKVKIEPL